MLPLTCLSLQWLQSATKMCEAIIEKLNQHCSRAPATEAEVVYTLVQVRKLLEKAKIGSNYRRLKFFCDWAVHGRLSGSEAQQVLIEIDDRLKFHDRRTPWEFDPDGQIGALISHHALCAELGRYLDEVGVKQIWTKDMFTWHKVSKLFSEVVRDCPLEIQRQGYSFPYISRLEITDCDPWEPIVKANLHQEHSGWNWTFTLSDGRTFQLGHSSSIQIGGADIRKSDNP
jgi:hypothetical protein